MMRTDDRSTIIATALEYAARGWLCLPIAPGKKLPACPNGVKDATAIASIFSTWWKRWPDAGIGIAGGGPARLVILDIDGEEGRVSLAALETRLGILPATSIARTPRGGEHRYFRLPADLDLARVRNSVAKLGASIDVRASGGYVVAPPTAGYSWVSEAPVAELPRAWAQRLLDLAKPGNAYASAALASAIERVRECPEGTRNDTLNTEAFGLGQLVAGGALSEHVVSEALFAAAIECGLSEGESRNTIHSGLTSGMASPRNGGGGAGGAGAGGRRLHSVPEDPPAPPEPDADAPWTSLLHYDRRGCLARDPANALVILSRAPQWQGTLAWDAFADRAVWIAPPPVIVGIAGGPNVGDILEDHHVTWVQLAMMRLHGGQFAKDALFDALLAVAHQRPFHRVRSWLESLRWDGIPRVGTWLTTYLGAEQTSMTQHVGQWWAVSCVARIAHPGCQVDHVLVLEGPQGCGKSTAVRILAGDWYLGSLPDLRERKAAAEALRGRWICEIGELDALRGAAATRVKDFLSQTIDYYRPAYGRLAVARPRECAFIATTNEHSYLTDGTGGRRFWPVAIRGLSRTLLEQDRPQLWAEAWHLLSHGARWWPDEVHHAELRELQEERYAVDDWERLVSEWLRGRTEDFTIGQVLEGALRMSPEKWDHGIQTRMGVILSRLGYRSRQIRRDGGRVRIFEIANDAWE